jgi:hypothetical protein
MNRLFSFKSLIILGLLIGMVIGFFFSNPITGSANAGISTPMAMLAPRPFVTLPGAWMVRLHMFRTKAPEIVSLKKIDEGRITVFQPGDNKIQILDASNHVVYEQVFNVEYLRGDPPQPADEITQILVLPVIDGAHTLVVTTPQGETHHDIPTP